MKEDDERGGRREGERLERKKRWGEKKEEGRREKKRSRNEINMK